jgi:hypothetical protein
MSFCDPVSSNSPSTDVRAAADLLNRVAGSGRCGEVEEEALRAVVGAVLRLYEDACVEARREIPPVNVDVSTTAAVTMACALARSQSLTPFDLALWFSHTAPRTEAAP